MLIYNVEKIVCNFLITKFMISIRYSLVILNHPECGNSGGKITYIMIFSPDLYNNLNAPVMFLFKGLVTYYLLAIINLVPIDDLCVFGFQYGVGELSRFFGLGTKNVV